MSLVTGGTVPIPQVVFGSGTLPTTPIQADPSAGTTPRRVKMLVDYTMEDDSGALSRPDVGGLSYPIVFGAGTSCMMSFCEAQALIQAGAARWS